ncbi:MAG: hypothetical protein LBP55_06410 [Candidatus Adiutrix sp.]|nr:hypothetical protein [Candidatus Adiutrix sp.]
MLHYDTWLSFGTAGFRPVIRIVIRRPCPFIVALQLLIISVIRAFILSVILVAGLMRLFWIGLMIARALPLLLSQGHPITAKARNH